MELKPRLKLRSPIETPFRRPKSITVFVSVDFASKKLKRCAAWSVQNVTIRCQLVRVVAATRKKSRRKQWREELLNNKRISNKLTAPHGQYSTPGTSELVFTNFYGNKNLLVLVRAFDITRRLAPVCIYETIPFSVELQFHIKLIRNLTFDTYFLKSGPSLYSIQSN